MLRRLFTGTTAGFISLMALATSSSASPNEPVTVDVYGASYSVELEYEATAQVLQKQPWWGNKRLASELCEALVYQGEEIASVGFNTLDINGEDYIEAYLVMPLSTCNGPVVIAPEDIGQMTGGTFFVTTGNGCLTNTIGELNAQIAKENALPLQHETISIINCGYFNNSILY